MKKLLSFILAFLFLLSFSACEMKIENQSGHASDNVNLEEALAYLSEIEPEHATVEDKGLVAPAQNAADGNYGFIDIFGNWVVEPVYFETKNITGNYGIALNNHSKYEYVELKTAEDQDERNVISYVEGYTLSESNHFSDGMLLASLNMSSDQKYVYLDKDFNWSIDASNLPKVDWRYYNNSWLFGYASPFNNGLAVVMRLKNASISDQGGPETAYVIDKSGEIVGNLPEGIDPYSAGFDDNGNIIVCDSSNRFGLCNKDGKLIIECKYRFLKHCDGTLYMACNENGFWGFIDQNDTIKVDFQYQKGMPFSEGHAAVFDGNHWGFIHEDGGVAIEFVFDDVAALNSPNEDSSLNQAAFKEGIAAVKAYGYWALIDSEENPIAILSESECKDIEGCPFTSIGNGYISFAKNVNGRVLYGVLNSEGKIVLDPVFGFIGSFR